MSKTYVIADLHGRFDLLEVALTKIANHVELPATLVTLGDYVDRGPDSRKVIEHNDCFGWSESALFLRLCSASVTPTRLTPSTL